MLWLQSTWTINFVMANGHNTASHKCVLENGSYISRASFLRTYFSFFILIQNTVIVFEIVMQWLFILVPDELSSKASSP
jgi:hypothetical protein